MADPRVLTISDLSESEIELLKLREDAKFSDDGKTVTLPPDKIDDRGLPDFEAGERALPVPPPPEHIAKRLAEGFAPPSSMSITEDGKVVKTASADGSTAAPPAPPAPEPKKASEEDVREYLRCVLGGKRFSKTYEFMGGHVKVTLQERSAEEDEDVMRRTAQIAAARGQGNNAIEITLLMAKYRLAYSLTRLDIGTTPRQFNRISVGSLVSIAKTEAPIYTVDERVSEIGDLGAILVSALYTAVVEFSEICGDLARRVTDPKSWQTPSAV